MTDKPEAAGQRTSSVPPSSSEKPIDDAKSGVLRSVPPPTQAIDDEWGGEGSAAKTAQDTVDDGWGAAAGLSDAETKAALSPAPVPAEPAAAPAAQSTPPAATKSTPPAATKSTPPAAKTSGPSRTLIGVPAPQGRTLIGIPAPANVAPARAADEDSSKSTPPVSDAKVDAEPAQPEPKPESTPSTSSERTSPASSERTSAPPSSHSVSGAVSSVEPRARSIPPDWGWNETEKSRRGSRLLWIAVAVVAVAGVVILVHQTSKPASTTAERMLAAASEPSAKPVAKPVETPASPPTAAPTPAPAPEPAASAPAAPASAPAQASAEPAAAPAAGSVTVTVEARPADAVFYRHGKRVSSSPMTVELAPGEKKAFELGKPGYTTRKVIVDGSQPKMLVGLRPGN